MNRVFVKIMEHRAVILRKLVILLCCAGAIGGLGCATWAAMSNVDDRKSGDARRRAYLRKAILTDSIYAFARADEALQKRIGVPDAIAFLGRKHTYLLAKGGEQLSSVSVQLDGRRLTLDSTAGSLFLKGKTVWGEVLLRYKTSDDPEKSSLEQRKLAALGFESCGQSDYRLLVPVEGVLCAPAKLRGALPSEFSRSRGIVFRRPPDSRPPPDLGAVIAPALVPLAVVVDVALVPAYLGLFLLVLTDM